MKPAISDMTAIRLLRENADDKDGKDPRAVPGFDWDRIDQILDRKRPPLKSITSTEFAAKKQIGLRQADHILRTLVASGAMETGLFATDGHRRAYFWLKEKDSDREQ